MKFTEGDIIKRPRGKMAYKILNVFKRGYRTFYRLENLINGRIYSVTSLKNFVSYDFKPIMNLKKKHGI